MAHKMLHCAAGIVAPVAQGFWEVASSGMIGAALGSVLEPLRAHFSSSQVLPQALHESLAKGVEMVEVALTGPKFYNKTAIKEFAQNFRKTVLLPVIQKHGFEEERFVALCLQDLETLKKQKFFEITAGLMPELAQEAGLYAGSDIAGLEKLQAQGRQSFAEEVVQATNMPYALAELLREHNVIAQAASLHLGVEAVSRLLPGQPAGADQATGPDSSATGPGRWSGAK